MIVRIVHWPRCYCGSFLARSGEMKDAEVFVRDKVRTQSDIATDSEAQMRR